MKTEMTPERYWLATGEGPMRPIVAEGDTRTEARESFLAEYSKQYSEMETHTHFALEDRQ